MSEFMKVTNRHHLRNDEIREVKETVSSATGVTLEGNRFERVEFESREFSLILIDGSPIIGDIRGDYFLTVRGANLLSPNKRIVTVDAGAVSFVSDGADVMRPGIVSADHSIATGDIVLVNEETHGKILAIGRALTDGDDMLGNSGKVIKSIHYVGDDLYQFRI